uniref:DUF4249 family protein n=1 Tax=Lacinutrix sp. TaxID=1937692 RepID=UPI0025BE7511
LPDIEYTLVINTAGGKTYSSNQQTLTPISQIDNLHAEFVDDDVNGPGVQVFVDSNNSNSEAKYFRYEYEETYQVIPPYYYPLEAILSNYEEEITNGDINVFYDVDFLERSQEEKTCYSTITNKNIIQTTTNDLEDNIVLNFPVRFINNEIGAEDIGIPIEENVTVADISILRDRYSILVKQYVQNIESYTFYKTTNILGNNESVLSESQPGSVEGNLSGLDKNEKIIGFFEVNSVSERRIFFNYSDFNLPQPDYIYKCEIKELNFSDNTTLDFDLNERSEIYRLITTFSDLNFNDQIIENPLINPNWKLSNPECTDCTTVGTNIEPDFWVD